MDINALLKTIAAAAGGFLLVFGVASVTASPSLMGLIGAGLAVTALWIKRPGDRPWRGL